MKTVNAQTSPHSTEHLLWHGSVDGHAPITTNAVTREHVFTSRSLAQSWFRRGQQFWPTLTSTSGRTKTSAWTDHCCSPSWAVSTWSAVAVRWPPTVLPPPGRRRHQTAVQQQPPKIWNTAVLNVNSIHTKTFHSSQLQFVYIHHIEVTLLSSHFKSLSSRHISSHSPLVTFQVTLLSSHFKVFSIRHSKLIRHSNVSTLVTVQVTGKGRVETNSKLRSWSKVDARNAFRNKLAMS